MKEEIIRKHDRRDVFLNADDIISDHGMYFGGFFTIMIKIFSVRQHMRQQWSEVQKQGKKMA